MSGFSFANALGFRPARRINCSLTARGEKLILLAMAHRAPAWLTSDQLTALGLGAQIGAGLGYGLARWNRYWLLAVILCLALNWLGDSLDGTLARVRGQERPRYGFYVDHAVDILGATALMAGLACSGFLHGPVAAGLLVAFLLLSAESYLSAYTLSCFELSHGFLGPTEIRILLVIGNLALLHSPWATLFGHTVLLFDLGGAIATVGMMVMLLYTVLCHTSQLYREEPLR